jgi:hypothetical protein
MAKPNNPKPQKGPSGHGKKSTPWNEDPEILRRLSTVEDLVLAGYRNTEIGHALQVSEATIRRDRERIAELWRRQATNDIVALRERSVAQFRRIQRMADNEFRNEREKPAMLKLQLDAEREIAKLQGTAAPTAVAHTFEKSSDLTEMTTEDLLQRAAALEALAHSLVEAEGSEELGG